MNERLCKDCGADISRRNCRASLCFPCLRAWGKRTGASKAVADVGKAIRRGELPKASALHCADCGGQASDYDHRDYNKPLDVQPVCRSCNKLRGPAIHATT